jgi:hypothetical protein
VVVVEKNYGKFRAIHIISHVILFLIILTVLQVIVGAILYNFGIQLTYIETSLIYIGLGEMLIIIELLLYIRRLEINSKARIVRMPILDGHNFTEDRSMNAFDSTEEP